MKTIKFVFIVVLSAFVVPGCSQQQSSEGPSPLFSDEIQTILKQERNHLHQEMDNPVYLDVLNNANLQPKKISLEMIKQLEEQWILPSPRDVLAQTLFNSACSERLRVFQSTHPEFAEIFITDRQGRNVCLTNKTSDYYQADEDWWINTNASNDPYGLHSPIEFDESASTESISLYLPVLDPATGNKMGILKAVVKLSHLAEEL